MLQVDGGCNHEGPTPLFFLRGYTKRWVFTEMVVDEEYGSHNRRVWLTWVYDLYTFISLYPKPVKGKACTIMSKEGFFLERLHGRPARLSYEECERQFDDAATSSNWRLSGHDSIY